jgi:hypothetical protein
MRPTPVLDLIAERAGQSMDQGGREELSALALSTLKLAMRTEGQRLADEGEAFGDGAKTELAKLFARHSPIGFLLALPELIGVNAMGFDDEEILEDCVLKCLEIIFADGCGGDGERE